MLWDRLRIIDMRLELEVQAIVEAVMDSSKTEEKCDQMVV